MGQKLSKREKLIITNDTKYLATVRNFAAQMVALSRLPRGDENKIVLAVDEAVTNVIEHGYEPNQVGPVEIEIQIDEDIFVIYIRDQAKAYNPDAKEDPDIMEHLKSGKKKGLGIFLIRQIMDEVKYQYKGGIQNELMMVKRVSR
jgi:serine/threonine-protein kinase RsbW